MNDLEIIEALQSEEILTLPDKLGSVISLAGVAKVYGYSSFLFRKNKLSVKQKRQVLLVTLKALKSL